MMTKKHYIALAAVSSCANAIADVMARDNPKFNRAQFLRAAGIAS